MADACDCWLTPDGCRPLKFIGVVPQLGNLIRFLIKTCIKLHCTGRKLGVKLACFYFAVACLFNEVDEVTVTFDTEILRRLPLDK